MPQNVLLNNLGTVKNTNVSPIQPKTEEKPLENADENNHNYKKYLKYAGIAAAAVAIGCGIVHFIKKGSDSKKVSEIIENIPEMADSVVFQKEKVKVGRFKKVEIKRAYDASSGGLFTGKVKKTMPDGINMIFDIKDGLIQKSVKQGEDGFTFLFDYKNNVLTGLTKTANGQTEFIDLKKLKKANKQFRNLTSTSSSRTSKNLLKNLNKIEHGSNAQKEMQAQAIEEIIAKRKPTIYSNGYIG